MSSGSVLSKLKPAQVIEITKAFMEFDDNDNGFITAQEMKECLGRSNVSHKDAEINEVIASMDANKDGTVSYEEYMKFMARMTTGQSSKSSQPPKKK
ncbi:unnamed protein product [Rotaria sordida]|uniref:EF-hand domain-containing protein n=2 Tax=Rotaria sordida TaxID=392033 RepID=A0A819BFF2_9BILA|nr:unnamed protein product [Rotaria sordida]CAF1053569.1 unnamed protein product [Rotaria sordida]CAF1228232.1 unnamed protein product [Rotaria sordida]CAF1234043.1 unnamed protein product [Rotaria sordida]CAF3657515.1 unnamed protein product [Rotaria sordida]